MSKRTVRSVRWGLGLAVCAASILAADAKGNAPGDGVAALDYGFRFATAIRTADKNKALAQQLVTLDYARIGELDLAVKRADEVIGWRRGVAYAEVAKEMVRAGRLDEARALVAKAEEVRKESTGWYDPRISAHVSEALALLGEVDESKRIASTLAEADSRQYRGRAAAAVAVGLAVRGEFDKAMELMASLDDSEDFDVTLWRTEGYLQLGSIEKLTPEQRRRALEDARVSAAGVQSWNQMDLLGRIGAALYEIGQTETGLETLEQAEAMVRSVSDEMPSKTALVAMVAGSWAEAERPARAKKLLADGLPAVESAMSIEQPGIYAQAASSYVKAGDEKAAKESFERGLAVAEALVNSRPRALAVVAICREMGRSGLAPDAATRARLDALYEGLGDPW